MPHEIGQVLKTYRNKEKITVKEISDILTQKGFKASESTIYSWENGNSQPTPGALLAMCSAYKIENILEAFGYDGYNEDGSIRLNMYEEDLVEKYRVLDTHGKEMVDLVLNKEYERSKSATAESNSDSEEKVYNIARAARGQQPLKMTEEQMKAFAESVKRAPNRSRDKDLF